MVKMIIFIVAYIVLAPFVGGFLAGLDRIISARMQGRVGPPVLQPFYDVLKLFEKEKITVNKVQDFYVACFLLFVVVTGCFFFAGGDLLLVLFTLTTASAFLIIAAYSSNSPYAQLGAERELLQTMAYEPMVLLTAVAFYVFTGSFKVSDIMNSESMGILPMLGIFIGFMYILTIKFRKAPFDLSMSHHAHQELVAGLKTEFSGTTLAMLEVAHWYENIFLLGFIFLFFQNGSVAGVIIGIVVAIIAFFFETFIGNSFARMKWQVAFKSAWIVAAVLGIINLFLLYFI
ncbi:MAG: NADH-quinone oxidoreductase subunit H [Eubacteriales bacterium]|nr:NADH-quinone oxidoreductase subunit H [Clostridiales bacterium]MDD7308743.1 NADH-quinone oxidoreductase subunit H [Eubacteriales bacterium]MDY2933413.1 NADH-quinone oxidoreductase subunit H [Anaerovoracaceae bacterium]MEE0180668.1 NADH-quinone oxidoreductase subunit H [Anaerovoracaceae bacterium]